ncbi:uncharacterized protein LOC126721785 [Quercus robur]|uniref:uncharacterized protein LOC126721785 n=1 Tax=Quercus robur TaxID=38942 RepID=UPI0021624AA0|nr:uncharacterized protein LOC126721785 [Quercus robur]
MEHPTSKLFSLKIRVTMFGVSKFQPRGGADSRTFEYKFKIRCNSCNTVSEDTIAVSLGEKKVCKCKNRTCCAQGNITLEPGHGREVSENDNMKFVPLMRFRCMGFYPQEFEFGDDWAATLKDREDEMNFQENLWHFENGSVLLKHNGDAASVYNLDSVFECIEKRISMI